MSNIEDIINNEDWSNRFDEIKGKDIQQEVKDFANRVMKENENIFNKDIFSSEYSQVLFEKIEMELRSFSMYYQIKGLIQNTDYEFAKNKVMNDTGIDEKTFITLMTRGQMLEAMVIFPRVAEYCADIFEITDDEESREAFKKMFGKEEDNDEL
tara:strand:+ start:116 stop:577 length:462 start_codon:yes stop_codon:yes gene_type:complete